MNSISKLVNHLLENKRAVIRYKTAYDLAFKKVDELYNVIEFFNQENLELTLNVDKLERQLSELSIEKELLSQEKVASKV